MTKPLVNLRLQVHGIVETCINVAEIPRAREFYQSLFSLEVMVSNERFCALRVGADVLLLFTPWWIQRTGGHTRRYHPSS
jgi:catechol-2,3-dioxygenase